MHKEGTFVEIPLPNGCFGVGRVLKDPLMCFYHAEFDVIPDMTDVVNKAIAFAVWVHRSALNKKGWRKIGFLELDGTEPDPFFFRQDAISKKLYLHKHGNERLATLKEVDGLERAAVWDKHHIEDRLDDVICGREQRWVRKLIPASVPMS